MEYAKQVQFRGGTAAEHSTFTGAYKEVTVDMTNMALVVHDGKTVGGFRTPTLAELSAKADKTLLELYRKVETSITYDDLDSEVQDLLNAKYDDTDIKKSIAELNASKLSTNEANNTYRSKNVAITTADLSDDLKTVIDNISKVESNINGKIDEATLNLILEGYRKTSVKIEKSDLSTSVQELLDKIAENENNITINKNNITALTSRIERIEENGDGSSGDSIWSEFEKTEILSKVNNLENASASHITADALTPLENNISTNASAINELNTKVATLETASNNHATKSSLEALRATVEENTNDISLIEGDITTLKAKVENFEAGGGSGSSSGEVSLDAFNSLVETVGTNSTNIATNKTNITSLTTQVGVLDTEVDTNATNIAANTAEINTLKTTVSSLDTSVKAAQASVGTMETKVGTMETTVNTCEEKVSTLNNTVSKNTEDINNILTKIDGYDTEIPSKVTALETKNSTNESNISTLTNQIGREDISDSILGRIKTMEDGGIDHATLDNLNSDEYYHLTKDERTQVIAMNSTVATLWEELEALKKQVAEGGTSSGGSTSTGVLDKAGQDRVLKYRVLFTTNGALPVTLNELAVVTDNNYNLPTLDDLIDGNDSAENNNVEFYVLGLMDSTGSSMYSTPKYLRLNEIEDENVYTDDTYLGAVDYDPESSIANFTGSNTVTVLVELRVYEAL